MEPDHNSATPLLDSWRAEVGDQAIADAVDQARRQIADGTLPGFTKKDQLLQYLQSRPRRSA